MKELFRSILDQTRRNQIAELKIEIEGKEYTRIFRPRERLILLGGGHVSKPVCNIASMLGFAVTVIDDRPSFANELRFPEATDVICDNFLDAIDRVHLGTGDYVAVMTRGHQYDAACLRKILSMVDPYYLGMLGSRRRTLILLKELEQEGFERKRLDAIHTPIGLDIGAMTIQEIAVSIMAELIKVRRQNVSRHSDSLHLTEELFDEEVLLDLVESDEPKAFMLVYATEGSTPVKSGAFMTVNSDFQTKGTIGGGYAEHAVLKEAFPMVGSGKNKCVKIDMGNDAAADLGMVCGGKMRVFISSDFHPIAKDKKRG